MKCQRCGGDFPKRKGRFCGTCPPKPSLALVVADVLLQTLAENAHQLVGGMAYVEHSRKRIEEAMKL